MHGHTQDWREESKRMVDKNGAMGMCMRVLGWLHRSLHDNGTVLDRKSHKVSILDCGV